MACPPLELPSLLTPPLEPAARGLELKGEIAVTVVLVRVRLRARVRVRVRVSSPLPNPNPNPTPSAPGVPRSRRVLAAAERGRGMHSRRAAVLGEHAGEGLERHPPIEGRVAQAHLARVGLGIG